MSTSDTLAPAAEKAMPKLTSTVEFVFKVKSSDFENFVADVYGHRQYEFQDTEEAPNDSEHRFKIRGGESLDRWDQERLEKFKAGKAVPFVTRLLLQDCVNRKIIAQGTYLITLSY